MAERPEKPQRHIILEHKSLMSHEPDTWHKSGKEAPIISEPSTFTRKACLGCTWPNMAL